MTQGGAFTAGKGTGGELIYGMKLPHENLTKNYLVEVIFLWLMLDKYQLVSVLHNFHSM